ncbi:hypothetical protein [Pengzhenrongella phosphoraccumulans]|uniref:hypothetical protein n=1 Tax=Pengzhenrongella phosphoraccumulans TaxID=3114394 RepID=UPI00388E7631
MSTTDQGRPEQPEPVQDTDSQDTVVQETAVQETAVQDTAVQDTAVQDTVPIDLSQVQPDAQPTLELAGLNTTTEFARPAAPEPAPAAEPADAAPVTAAAPAPMTAPLATPAPARPGPRVGTVVWGLVLAVIGAGVIAAAAGAQFDVELVSIALLALAGVGLVVGSIATSARRRHR